VREHSENLPETEAVLAKDVELGTFREDCCWKSAGDRKATAKATEKAQSHRKRRIR